MAKLQINISHSLPQPEALRRVKNLLGEVKVQFADKVKNLHEEWNGNLGTFRFAAMGFDVSGTLEVKNSSVELNGTLPFAAAFFKKQIETTIREHAAKLLA